MLARKKQEKTVEFQPSRRTLPNRFLRNDENKEGISLNMGAHPDRFFPISVLVKQLEGRKMADDDFPTDSASSAKPFKVGIMPTEDGDKVVLVMRSDEDDQRIFWLETSAAIELAEALLVVACGIEDEGRDRPPTQN